MLRKFKNVFSKTEKKSMTWKPLTEYISNGCELYSIGSNGRITSDFYFNSEIVQLSLKYLLDITTDINIYVKKQTKSETDLEVSDQPIIKDIFSIILRPDAFYPRSYNDIETFIFKEWMRSGFACLVTRKDPKGILQEIIIPQKTTFSNGTLRGIENRSQQDIINRKFTIYINGTSYEAEENKERRFIFSINSTNATLDKQDIYEVICLQYNFDYETRSFESPLVQVINSSIAIHNYSTRFISSFFANSARPSMIITVEAEVKNEQSRIPDADDTLKTLATIERVIKERLKGSSNVGNIPVIYIPGFRVVFTPISTPINETKILEFSNNAVEMILNFFGISRDMFYGQAKYTNAKESKVQTYFNAIKIKKKILNSLTNALLIDALFDGGVKDATSYYLDINENEVREIAEYSSTVDLDMVVKGVMTPNEFRETVGLKGIDGANTLLVGSTAVSSSEQVSSDYSDVQN